MKLGVVGAGVIGLTTALELQKEFRNAQIDIIAEQFYEQTTSYVAAGIFRPGTSFSGPNEEITKQWINNSYNYWDALKNNEESAKAGVMEISGYIFSSISPNIVKNHFLEKLVPVYRAATEKELNFLPGNWKYGSYFTTLLIEGKSYLPWAIEKFKHSGGNVKSMKVENLGTLSSDYDILVNCTGLGAKYLVNDKKLVPLRGQVIKVEAPWIKTFFYGDYDTYIIPGFNSVTLGGCRQYDSYDLNFNKYDYLKIKERCEALVPSLKGAKILNHFVGLRPHRDPVRVEKEIMKNFNGKSYKVVHNYGHGGYGWTSAPGTALYACGLVRELIVGNNKL